ncbi:Sfum_1244 family protein [Thermodesulfovibrio sp. TK110]
MLNSEFFKTVRYNCDVSDANYWGYFSICTLLLRLRELYKIERGLEPWDSISNDEILPWIEKKEAVWKELENASLIPFQINGKSYSPFDIDEINSIIVNNGFVYGAGFALFMKPSFFVGSIYKFEKIDGYNVYFVDREIVRDIFSSPGMSVGDTIFIRLTDIKYRLWEDLQSWSVKNCHELISKSGISHEYSPQEFKKIVDIYSKIVLYHEIAEQELNSSCWNEIIKKCDNSKTEHILRGIIDFVADFSEKGPIHKAFLERNKELLSLYILTQGAYQKKILKPILLQIQKALISEDWQKIEEIRNLEFNRWKNKHEEIQEIFKLQGFEAIKNLTNRIFEGGVN